MIVGGEAAREHEFPWQVSLRRKATNSHFCGGSIINGEWVLTAAHCASGETPAIMSVVVGDHTRNDGTNTVRRSLDVSRIIMHPNYNSRTLVNDIALVKLAAPIIFNTADIQPICGPEQNDQFVYRKTFCSGWGTLSSGGACCPQTLQYVSMNITTNAYCNNAYPRDQITDDMICATDNTGSTQRDSCQGDSGGPLFVQDDNGNHSLVGIVSWGIGCASGYPGVYARVTHFHDWILNTMSAN
jgi:secreted trypsin-like serine protease